MKPEILSAIKEILTQTKENDEVILSNFIDREVLEHLGFNATENKYIIDRENRINLAKLAVQEGAEIGAIVQLLTWKDFEGFVASILIANSYHCIESFRRRGNSLIHGMEIDVIGVSGPNIIAIDAKMWSIRRGKVSALKKAAEKQKTRTRELSRELDQLAKKIDKLPPKEYHLYPVLVTWLVEDVELYEGVPVVPIFKLNSFILDFYRYEEMIVSYIGIHS